MKTLLFLTDRFPFGRGEAFIENEIEYIADAFDKVYILPVGLTVNVKEKRNLPGNVEVLPPANTMDLYENGRPSKVKRMAWSLRYMTWWSVKALFSCDFRKEINHLKGRDMLNWSTFKGVIRTVAPVIRNEVHFKKALKNIELSLDDEIYVYSYWINGLLLRMDNILDDILSSRDNKKATNAKDNRVIKEMFARAHRYDLYDEIRDVKYIPLKDGVIDRIDRLYLISKDGLEYISKKNEKNKHKYRLSYLGTRDYIESQEVGSKEIGKNDAVCLNIVSCSFVIPVKRVEKIIESLSLVESISVKWTHFGGGQDLDKMKEYGKKLLSHKDNIQYEFAGYIKNADLMEYYKSNRVDLFVNVSEHEGLPVSIMEAMSFGIPIIATDVGSTRETIVEGESGYLLDAYFDNKTLATLIEEYGKKQEAIKTDFRLLSRRVWEERFSASNNYRNFVEDILG